jgi:hypothetical protein
MNLLGFTAEASLYKTDRPYYTAHNFSQTTGSIKAAFTLGSGGYLSCFQICQGDPDCIQCCLCVRHGGHPWQCCF